MVTASHGLDALTKFQDYAGNFSAILTDSEMPRMSGLEFIRTIRAKGFTGRIIVMSGNLKAADLRNYRDQQISGFFGKPFEIDMVAALLARANAAS